VASNSVDSAEVKITTTQQVVSMLKTLAKTGLYGKNHSQVAEELVRRGIRKIYGDQALAGKPPGGGNSE